MGKVIRIGVTPVGEKPEDPGVKTEVENENPNDEDPDVQIEIE